MLSDSSRSRAMKVDAFSLKLTQVCECLKLHQRRTSQVTNVQFFIVIKTGGEDFYVDNSNQYVFSERMKRLKVEVKVFQRNKHNSCNWVVNPHSCGVFFKEYKNSNISAESGRTSPKPKKLCCVDSRQSNYRSSRQIRFFAHFFERGTFKKERIFLYRFIISSIQL